MIHSSSSYSIVLRLLVNHRGGYVDEFNIRNRLTKKPELDVADPGLYPPISNLVVMLNLIDVHLVRYPQHPETTNLH